MNDKEFIQALEDKIFAMYLASIRLKKHVPEVFHYLQKWLYGIDFQNRRIDYYE
jgi:hypothetical protein